VGLDEFFLTFPRLQFRISNVSMFEHEDEEGKEADRCGSVRAGETYLSERRDW